MKTLACLLLFAVSAFAAPIQPGDRITFRVGVNTFSEVKVVDVSGDWLVVSGTAGGKWVKKFARADLPPNVVERMPAEPPPPPPPLDIENVKRISVSRRKDLDNNRSTSVSLSVSPVDSGLMFSLHTYHPDARLGSQLFWFKYNPKAKELAQVEALFQKFLQWTAQSTEEKIPEVSRALGKVGDVDFDFDFSFRDNRATSLVFLSRVGGRAGFSPDEVRSLIELLKEEPAMLSEFWDKADATRKAALLK